MQAKFNPLTILHLFDMMADVGSERMNHLIKEIEPRISSISNPERYNVELTDSSIIFIKGANYLVKNLKDSSGKKNQQ